MNFEDLQKLTLEWADDKDLLHGANAEKQFMKFIEEVFEFNVEMVLGLNYIKQTEYIGTSIDQNLLKIRNLKLEMGDIFVTLIILCEQIGIDPVECLSMAYEKISKRTGKTIGGQFIKSEDL